MYYKINRSDALVTIVLDEDNLLWDNLCLWSTIVFHRNPITMVNFRKCHLLIVLISYKIKGRWKGNEDHGAATQSLSLSYLSKLCEDVKGVTLKKLECIHREKVIIFLAGSTGNQVLIHGVALIMKNCVINALCYFWLHIPLWREGTKTIYENLYHIPKTCNLEQVGLVVVKD